ncbi:t26-2p [Thermococcus sp.]|uniref:t26-2p n=1 Tax=Thermococcus sp. TaxID=35749 RepID=UPI00262EB87D|nr:t26-2p [Thermococcus sp.]
MAQRIGKSTTFVRGIYVDEDIMEMARALARVKKTSINQIFREGVVKLYKQEIGDELPHRAQ